MQTTLAEFIAGTAEGDEAKKIIGKCVHCGFCTATCPTYQLLGNEQDSPRGRIYLIKEMLEGSPATESIRNHLDRCLTCRNCETTCPSGVKYGRLVEIGRKVSDELLEESGVKRPLTNRVTRWLLREGLTRPTLFKAAYGTGRFFSPILPAELQKKLVGSHSTKNLSRPKVQRDKKVMLLEGCVQPAMSPNINAATARVLDKLGYQTLSSSKVSCCGAVRLHTGDPNGAMQTIKNNIDAWLPYIESGEISAIIMNASGCGATVKEYGHLLKDDPDYALKAARISAYTKDVSEYLHGELEAVKYLASTAKKSMDGNVVYHPPCTLQHGQSIRGKVEAILSEFGVQVSLCKDSHICCGSAGTYSVLQPELSTKLRNQKIKNINDQKPNQVVSANIGCISHLQSGMDKPVKHWIELIDEKLASQA